MAEITILDRIKSQLRKVTFFRQEVEYDTVVLLIAATHFIPHRSTITSFRAFPYLALISPEPGSGKSDTLNVCSRLCHNGKPPGAYTRAALLDIMDEVVEKNPLDVITAALDNLETIFTNKKDNADLITAIDLGYKDGSPVVRMDRFQHKRRETPTYFPKLFAGRATTKFEPSTLSRTLVIRMAEKTEEESEGMEELSLEVFDQLVILKDAIATWANSEAVLALMRTFKSDEFKAQIKVINRDKEILYPLLAVGKATNEDWYQRAIDVVKSFSVTSEKKSRDWVHKTLLGCYHVSRMRPLHYEEKISTAMLLELGHEVGIPAFVDANLLAKVLEEDYEISRPPNPMHFYSGERKRGWEWRRFTEAFDRYISPKEREEVELALGLEVEGNGVTGEMGVAPPLPATW